MSKQINQDNIRSLIQEWFCDCMTSIEVSLLYGELYHEILRGMEERMESLRGENECQTQ